MLSRVGLLSREDERQVPQCYNWEWRPTRTCWEVNALVAATGHIFGKVTLLFRIVGGESTSLVIVGACEWDF
jgi:hypothetical protein